MSRSLIIIIITTLFGPTNFLFASVDSNQNRGNILTLKTNHINDSVIRKNDTLKFNYIIEYKELRKKTGKTFKRYYLINTNDSILNRGFYIYDHKDKLILTTQAGQYDVKFPFNRKLLDFNKSLVFHVEEDNNLAKNAKLYFMKFDKIDLNNQSKVNLKRNKLVFKARLYHKNVLIVNYKEIYDTTDERFKILMLSKSFTNSEEINKNTKGVLKSAEYFDYDVQSKITLKLKKILPVQINVIVDKSAKRAHIEVDSLDQIDY